MGKRFQVGDISDFKDLNNLKQKIYDIYRQENENTYLDMILNYQGRQRFLRLYNRNQSEKRIINKIHLVLVLPMLQNLLII